MRYNMTLILALFLFIWSAGLNAATITVTSTNIDLRQNTLHPFTGSPVFMYITNGDCTLIEAVVAANTDTATGGCPAGSGADTIILPAGVYILSLSSAHQYAGRAFPEITSPVTIEGQGSTPHQTRISKHASYTFGLFRVAAGGHLTLNNLKLSDAISYQQHGGAIHNAGGQVTLTNVNITSGNILSWGSTEYRGGALYNGPGGVVNITGSTFLGNKKSAIFHEGNSLTIQNSTFNLNQAPEMGGAIYALANVNLTDSFVTNNTVLPAVSNALLACATKGGGLYLGKGATIGRVTFSSNSAECGGAIYLYSALNPPSPFFGANYDLTLITKSSFYNNSATNGSGGAIRHHQGVLDIRQSTFTQNSAARAGDCEITGLCGQGGAISKLNSNSSSVPMPTYIRNATIIGNTADHGGGIYIHAQDTNGGVEMQGTILQANTASQSGPNCKGNLTSQGYNVFQTLAGDNCVLSFNYQRSSNKLIPTATAGLVMNTGTPGGIIFPLVAASSAVDAANNSIPGSAHDQLNTNRQGTRDIGAVEYSCGDGVVAIHETCDDGNTDNTDDCTTLCEAPVCGDGFVQPGNGEECDDGNLTVGDGCNAECALEVCGDGVLQAGRGEECDDGNVASGDGCSAGCQTEAVCGDGLVEDPEQCDDGNVASGDGCSSGCVIEECGDGVLQAVLGEECDDGNEGDDDDCHNDCTIEYCGNGIVDAEEGEECDDGKRISNDGCNAQCQLEVCGDGMLQLGLGESCDDGNTLPNDGCGPTCNGEECGDGIVQTGEACDDGNKSNNDDCTIECAPTTCGDGFLKITGETPEQCDDSNTENGDGCSADCTTEAAAAEPSPSEPVAEESPVSEPVAPEIPASEPVESEAESVEPESAESIIPPSDDIVVPEASDDIVVEAVAPTPEFPEVAEPIEVVDVPEVVVVEPVESESSLVDRFLASVSPESSEPVADGPMESPDAPDASDAPDALDTPEAPLPDATPALPVVEEEVGLPKDEAVDVPEVVQPAPVNESDELIEPAEQDSSPSGDVIPSSQEESLDSGAWPDGGVEEEPQAAEAVPVNDPNQIVEEEPQAAEAASLLAPATPAPGIEIPPGELALPSDIPNPPGEPEVLPGDSPLPQMVASASEVPVAHEAPANTASNPRSVPGTGEPSASASSTNESMPIAISSPAPAVVSESVSSSPDSSDISDSASISTSTPILTDHGNQSLPSELDEDELIDVNEMSANLDAETDSSVPEVNVDLSTTPEQDETPQSSDKAAQESQSAAESSPAGGAKSGCQLSKGGSNPGNSEWALILLILGPFYLFRFFAKSRSIS